jgi:hypothetical protein
MKNKKNQYVGIDLSVEHTGGTFQTCGEALNNIPKKSIPNKNIEGWEESITLVIDRIEKEVNMHIS